MRERVVVRIVQVQYHRRGRYLGFLQRVGGVGRCRIGKQRPKRRCFPSHFEPIALGRVKLHPCAKQWASPQKRIFSHRGCQALPGGNSACRERMGQSIIIPLDWVYGQLLQIGYYYYSTVTIATKGTLQQATVRHRVSIRQSNLF